MLNQVVSKALTRPDASYHFSDTIGSAGLSFDYQLRDGPAQSRNAIALLEMHGAPARLVRRALRRLVDLDDQRRSGRPASDRDRGDTGLAGSRL